MATLIISVLVFLASYLCFHFVTDDGISFIWHSEAGKPYAALLIVVLGVMFIFASAMSLIIAQIFYPKGKKDKITEENKVLQER